MSKQIFEAGDVVKLCSGGPEITVVRYEPKDGEDVICQWFYSGQLMEKAFHQNTLKLYRSKASERRKNQLLGR